MLAANDNFVTNQLEKFLDITPVKIVFRPE